MPVELLIATRNEGKVTELQQELLIFKLLSLAATSCNFDVEETGETYLANSVLKAEQYGQCAGILTLADDSGFEVEALDNRPGVYSARYAPGSDRDRCQALLNELGASTNRNARFVSVITVFDPESNQQHSFEGVVTGTVTTQIQGEQGFGYDPIFIPDGYADTFAQLDQSIKRSISHRSRALSQAAEYLKENYAS